MGRFTKKRRAAAGWCDENNVKPGAVIETSRFGPWDRVRVTGIGESAILLRRKGGAEFAHYEPTQLRLIENGDPRA